MSFIRYESDTLDGQLTPLLSVDNETNVNLWLIGGFCDFIKHQYKSVFSNREVNMLWELFEVGGAWLESFDDKDILEKLISLNWRVPVWFYTIKSSKH